MKTSTKILLGVGAVGVIALMIKNDTAKRNPPKIYLRSGGRYNARTIPPFGVFIDRSQINNKALLRHELIHWNQYRKNGLINFYAQYLNEYLTHGYDKMPMEIAARDNESAFCKTNYTACVRNGRSNTVHNPKFLL